MAFVRCRPLRSSAHFSFCSHRGQAKVRTVNRYLRHRSIFSASMAEMPEGLEEPLLADSGDRQQAPMTAGPEDSRCAIAVGVGASAPSPCC